MKKFTPLLPLVLLTSCTWLATHPQEDLAALGALEQGVEELYQYESRTLSPAPQQLPPGTPPLKATK